MASFGGLEWANTGFRPIEDDGGYERTAFRTSAFRASFSKNNSRTLASRQTALDVFQNRDQVGHAVDHIVGACVFKFGCHLAANSGQLLGRCCLVLRQRQACRAVLERQCHRPHTGAHALENSGQRVIDLDAMGDVTNLELKHALQRHPGAGAGTG